MIILDSWALLAWLQDERPAADEVDELLANVDRAPVAMSRINAGEIYYVIAKSRSISRAEEFRRVQERMPITLASVTDDQVWRAARLKAIYPLSYADGFAAALALHRDATLVTGDREFEPLVDGEGLKIQWLTRDAR